MFLSTKHPCYKKEEDNNDIARLIEDCKRNYKYTSNNF